MNKKILIIILLILSLAVHFLFFGHPNEVVFDEIWYGRLVNDYIKGTFHFDGHPPLGRMSIAGFAKVLGYMPNFSFENLGIKYPDKQYLILRFLPSLAGSLLPIVVFLIMQELGISLFASFAGSLFLVFDNGLLVQSRFILMDALLLLYGFTSVLFYLKYRNQKKKYLLFLAGIFGICAFSVKWNALSFVGLPILIECLSVLKSFTKSGLRFIDFSKILLLFFALFAVPLVIYFSIITAYSLILHKSGVGDAFMSPAYQKTIDGNQYQQRPDLKTPNVFQKFAELNEQMYLINQGLTASHPYSSKWYTWPLMMRPIYYWVSSAPTNSGQFARIYFIGNPVVWWVSTAGILFAFLLIVLRTVRRRIRKNRKQAAKTSDTLLILLAGYILNLLPFVGIKRVMFLYHYLPALIFAVIILTYLLDSYFANTNNGDKKSKRIFAFLLVLTVAAFLFFAPFSYGLKLSPEAYKSRIWFAKWE